MSTQNHIAAGRPRGESGPKYSAKLAHELSNLVDGSLRNLSLAMTRLDAIDDTDSDDMTDRLHASATAMKQMAALLQRFMGAGASVASGGGPKPARLHWSDATVSEAVECAMRMVDPVAAESDITVRADTAVLDTLPVGPLYPVISNAIKNAVEAIGRGGNVDVVASLNGDTATLRIVDNGCGIGDNVPLDASGMVMAGYTSKTNGHGTGLAVSRQIIESIGGTMTLANRTRGGAVLTVNWDVNKIAKPQAAHGDTK